MCSSFILTPCKGENHKKRIFVESVGWTPDLMLQAAVLALRVLSDDDDVNVLVARLDSRKWLAVHQIGIKIQTRAKRVTVLRVNWGQPV